MNVEKSQFVSVVMERDVRMNKKNNPFFGQVKKITKGNYLTGNSYETRVQNNEEKEGMERQFKTERCSIGEHISKCVLYNEKLDTHYFQMERFPEIHPTSTEYIFEGSTIEEVLFKDFVQKESESRKQQQQRKVELISPKMETIKEITLNGTHYIIE